MSLITLISNIYQSPIWLLMLLLILIIFRFQSQIALFVKQLYWLSKVPGPPAIFPFGNFYLFSRKNHDVIISKKIILVMFEYWNLIWCYFQAFQDVLIGLTKVFYEKSICRLWLFNKPTVMVFTANEMEVSLN